MRVSLALSFIAHTALLVASVVALPAATPLRVEEPPPVPVEILTLDEFTKLTSKKTEVEKKPVPKPVKKVVEKPKPKPKKPPKKVVEPVVEPKTVAAVIKELPVPEPAPVAPPEPPKPEPPKPEPVAKPLPAPEPAPQPIAEPAPKPKVEPKKPVEKANTPPAPRVKPKPPKKIAKKKPRKPKVVKKKKKPKPKFNADRIAALLNKLPGDPQEAAPETSGRSKESTLRVASLDQLVTRSEMEYLRQQISRCWSPPVGIEGAENLAVKVKLNLRRDGSLAAAPIVLNTGPTGFDVAADAAVRAVNECAPFDMPGEKFDAWAEVIFNFDPRFMLGG